MNHSKSGRISFVRVNRNSGGMPMTAVANVSDFGALIRQARKEQGLTQTDLAEWCGVGINFVSDVERGKPTVEMGRALRLAQMLGIDIVAQKRGA